MNLTTEQRRRIHALSDAELNDKMYNHVHNNPMEEAMLKGLMIERMVRDSLKLDELLVYIAPPIDTSPLPAYPETFEELVPRKKAK